MAYQKFAQVKNFLQKFHPQYPILLFYGDNYGLVAHNAAHYVKLASKELGIKENDEFSLIKFYASALQDEPGKLLKEIRTRSFLSPNKILWIKEASANFANILKTILGADLSHTIIIIEAKELKTSSALRSTVEKAANTMALPCLLDNDGSLTNFLDEILQQYNLTIDYDNKKLLLRNLNSDFLLAKSELTKLCLYCAKQKTIELEDILNICSDISTLNLYEIIDAILIGDLNSFAANFNNYILNGKNSQIILGTLLRQFKELQIFAYDITINHATASSLLKNARPPIYFKRQKIIEKALKIWQLEYIARALIYLQEASLQARKNYKLADSIVQKTCLKLAAYAKNTIY